MSTKGKNADGYRHEVSGVTDIYAYGGYLPSTAGDQAINDDSRYEETRDGFILGFNIVREISEATDLLAPLKLLIVRGLETTRVSTFAWDSPIEKCIPDQIYRKLTTIKILGDI
jgi:hypothetical protein